MFFFIAILFHYWSVAITVIIEVLIIFFT